MHRVLYRVHDGHSHWRCSIHLHGATKRNTHHRPEIERCASQLAIPGPHPLDGSWSHSLFGLLVSHHPLQESCEETGNQKSTKNTHKTQRTHGVCRQWGRVLHPPPPPANTHPKTQKQFRVQRHDMHARALKGARIGAHRSASRTPPACQTGYRSPHIRRIRTLRIGWCSCCSTTFSCTLCTAPAPAAAHTHPPAMGTGTLKSEGELYNGLP